MSPPRRAIIPEHHGQHLTDVLALRSRAHTLVELAIAEALQADGSVRKVSELTGMSTKTVKK